MKAKEYAANYQKKAQADGENKALVWLFIEFHKEALALGMQRSNIPRPPDRVTLPILREFDQKWRAVAREIPALRPDGWKNWWKSKGILF